MMADLMIDRSLVDNLRYFRQPSNFNLDGETATAIAIASVHRPPSVNLGTLAQ